MLRRALFKDYTPPAQNGKKISPAVENFNIASHALGSANFVTIFSMFAKESWHQLLELKARFALFSFAAIIDWVFAGIEWHNAWVSKKPSALVRAMLYTFVAAGITAAVVGLFVAHAAFVVASPYIFGISLGSKALYFVKSAIWNALKLNFREGLDLPGAEKKRSQYKTAILKDSVSAVIGSIMTVAVTGVFILLKPFLFPIGIIGGGLGTVYALGTAAYKLGTYFWEKRKLAQAGRGEYEQIPENSNDHEAKNAVSQSFGSRLKAGFSAVRNWFTRPVPSAQLPLIVNSGINNAGSPASSSRQNIPSTPVFPRYSTSKTAASLTSTSSPVSRSPTLTLVDQSLPRTSDSTPSIGNSKRTTSFTDNSKLSDSTGVTNSTLFTKTPPSTPTIKPNKGQALLSETLSRPKRRFGTL